MCCRIARLLCMCVGVYARLEPGLVLIEQNLCDFVIIYWLHSAPREFYSKIRPVASARPSFLPLSLPPLFSTREKYNRRGVLTKKSEIKWKKGKMESVYWIRQAADWNRLFPFAPFARDRASPIIRLRMLPPRIRRFNYVKNSNSTYVRVLGNSEESNSRFYPININSGRIRIRGTFDFEEPRLCVCVYYII